MLGTPEGLAEELGVTTRPAANSSPFQFGRLVFKPDAPSPCIRPQGFGIVCECFTAFKIRTPMSEHSKIEWTDATWNPLRGCTKVSPGCKHCYASTFAERFRGVLGHPYEQGFDLRLVPEKLHEPFVWSSPRTVFVNSMSDLFQEGVPEGYIEDVVRVMVEAKWHTYQVLTKRSERLRDLLNGNLRFASRARHIWWGVSVEDRRYGLPRVKHLQATKAAVRFLSIEPLLEDIGGFDISGIDWAIVGGESGRGARPMER